MKTEYKVPSERYNHVHRFVQAPSGDYVFVPEEDWMPLYVTGKSSNIRFIDTEGGPIIGVGFKTDEVEVVDMHQVGDEIYFKLIEIK